MLHAICIPLSAYPSCLQATLASLVDQNPSQMVPQVSFQHSSTRPWAGTALPASLRSPLLQTTGKDRFRCFVLFILRERMRKNNRNYIFNLKVENIHVVLQRTPASSKCWQSVVSGSYVQLIRLYSAPVQDRLSSQMGPVPCP